MARKTLAAVCAATALVGVSLISLTRQSSIAGASWEVPAGGSGSAGFTNTGLGYDGTDMLIGDNTNSRIVKTTTAGAYVSEIVLGGSPPANSVQGVTWDSSRSHYWVAHYAASGASGSLRRYNASGTLQDTITTANVGGPNGCVYDSANDRILACFDDGKVRGYDCADGSLDETITLDASLGTGTGAGPDGVDIDPASGTVLWITSDASPNRIYKVTRATGVNVTSYRCPVNPESLKWIAGVLYMCADAEYHSSVPDGNRVWQMTTPDITADFAGYAEAVLPNPSGAITDVHYYVSLDQMPADWWTAVQADGDDIRATDGSNNELPVDIIEFTDSGTSGTGLLCVAWRGTKAASGSDKLRIWVGNASASRPDAYELIGQYNAYTPNCRVSYPNGGGDDHTGNATHLTMTGATAGGVSGGINGSKATDYSGSGQYGIATAAAGVPITFVAQVNPDTETTSYVVFGIFAHSAANDHNASLQLRGDVASDPVRARQTTTGQTGASDKTDFAASAWQDIAAVFASSTSRTAYLNGVAGTTDTTTVGLASISRIAIATYINFSDTKSAQFAGLVSFAEAHTVALSADWLAYRKEMLDDADQVDFYGTWTWTSGTSSGLLRTIILLSQFDRQHKQQSHLDRYGVYAITP